jgi:NitT/TauT family transport system substrate-binding protein
MRLLSRLVAAALLLCTLAPEPPGARASAADGGARPRVRLQLKWLPQAQFAGYYVALDRRFYAEEGLDVAILPGGPSIASEEVVNAGNAEFGVDWLESLLVAREAGKPLVNVAQIFQRSGMRLITFRDSGIESIDEFRGKRVGVWFAGNEFRFMALMDKHGMDPPADFMTVVSQPAEMTSFLERDLDVAHAMTYNELITVEEAVGREALRIFDYNKLGFPLLEDGLFARKDWLRANREVAVRFLRASIRGWKWAQRHPRAAGRISFRHAPRDTSGGLHHQIRMAEEVAELLLPKGRAHHPIGYMDADLYRKTWKTLKQERVIHSEPENAYTREYWRAAVAGN